MTGGGLWSGMTERGRWQGVFICGHSGFPITNVGNDRRGFLSGMTGDLLLGITEGVLFIWERGMLMTCVMRTMRQPAFFRRMANPAGPLPVTPAGPPPCHARRPLSVIPAGPSLSCRRPFPVMLAGPSLSCRRPLPVIPVGPSLSCPPALLCHAAGPSLSCLPAPPCHACRPLPVILAGPSLSCLPALLCHARRPPSVIPAVSSGNPVKTVFPQVSTRESYPFGKASMTSES